MVTERHGVGGQPADSIVRVVDGTVTPAPPVRSYRVAALAKGLRLLTQFTAERPVLAVKELVELTGIPMPTVFRLVATLEEEHYLERTTDGRVRPGTGVLALGFAAMRGLDLVQTSSSLIRALAATTGETVNLGVLSNDQVLFVARVPRRNSVIAADIRIGSTVPAVFSSIGKLILAHLHEDEFDRRISERSFEGRWGPKAVRTIVELRRQLAAARRDGYLVQRDEAIPGLSSIAAPVWQTGDVVAAGVNIAVPTGEYTTREIVERFLPPLLETTRAISTRLGGQPT